MASFTLRQLQIFVTVAKRENLAAAGRELRLSHATMSEALRTLEGLLDQSLFDRSNRRLTLNVAGRSFLKDAQRLLSQSDAVFRLHRGRARLHFGASVTLGNYILPPLVLALAKEHPDLEIDVVIRNTEGIARMILDRDIEAGIVEGTVTHPKLEAIQWRRDELVIFGRPDDPLADGATEEMLANARWILREPGSGTRESFDDLAEGWNSRPQVAMTAGGNEIIKQAVIAGLGIGCLSRAAVERELSEGALAIIPAHVRLYRTLTFIHRREAHHDYYLAEFAKMLGIALPTPEIHGS